MKLIGFTCTYNEAEMVPYVMPYIERLGYDKFIVYDDESTDNTVELLEQYPFVEVRSFRSQADSQYDYERVQLMYDSFCECKMMTETNEYGGEEEVWMSWTDFDEVLYTSSLYDSTLKGVLTKILNNNENVFATSMINIVPPKEYENVRLIDVLNPNQLVHELNGCRCKLIENFLGNKACLFKVNDIEDISTHPGNHLTGFKMKEGKELIFIESSIYFFHLKLVDKQILRRKYDEIPYVYSYLYEQSWDKTKFETIYDSIVSTSYPLHEYFMACDLKQLRVNENKFNIGHVGVYLL